MAAFNLSKNSGLSRPRLPQPEGTPHRIKDRGIKWEETYREKSDDLKVRFAKMIGPGAYYRWEGHDNWTDSDYFVVVGPAVTKNGKKKFFSGIKKLPKDPEKKHFAPSGEYFGNIHAALSHASEKWGIVFPKGQPNYREEILQPLDIPRHVKGSSERMEKESQGMPTKWTPFGYAGKAVANLVAAIDLVRKSSFERMGSEAIQQAAQKTYAEFDNLSDQFPDAATEIAQVKQQFHSLIEPYLADYPDAIAPNLVYLRKVVGELNDLVGDDMWGRMYRKNRDNGYPS